MCTKVTMNFLCAYFSLFFWFESNNNLPNCQSLKNAKKNETNKEKFSSFFVDDDDDDFDKKNARFYLSKKKKRREELSRLTRVVEEKKNAMDIMGNPGDGSGGGGAMGGGMGGGMGGTTKTRSRESSSSFACNRKTERKFKNIRGKKSGERKESGIASRRARSEKKCWNRITRHNKT